MRVANLGQSGVKTMSTKIDHKVGDVMVPLGKTPKTFSKTLLKEAIELMDLHRLGVICVVDEQGVLQGILTDGDIRRILIRVQKPFAALLSDDIGNHLVEKPETITATSSLHDAIRVMGERQIWDLPVVEASGRLVGLLHLHPAIKAVIASS